jgi:hypothetical protein
MIAEYSSIEIMPRAALTNLHEGAWALHTKIGELLERLE